MYSLGSPNSFVPLMPLTETLKIKKQHTLKYVFTHLERMTIDYGIILLKTKCSKCTYLTGAHYEPVVRFTCEVPLVLHHAIVLTHWCAQLNTQPYTLREFYRPDISYNSCNKINSHVSHFKIVLIQFYRKAKQGRLYNQYFEQNSNHPK